MDWDAIIVGGGCAGLAAATALSEQRRRVLVLERRTLLGGRTSSFEDPKSGEVLDNGQHLFLGCYWETKKYLKRIGSIDQLQFQPAFETTMIGPNGEKAPLKAMNLKAPYHILGGLFRFKALGMMDRLNILRVASSAKKAEERLKGLSVSDWLYSLGQSKRARERFWDPLTLATLNSDPDKVPASLLATVFRRGFLASGEASQAGLAKIGLSDLLGRPAREYLEKNGSKIELGAAVKNILFANGQAAGVELASGRKETATSVICAVPPDALENLLLRAPTDVKEEYRRSDQLQSSPIVSLHVWLNQDLFDDPFVGFWGKEFHWVFRKSEIFGESMKAKHYSLVISGAHRWIDASKAQLVEMAEKELNEAFHVKEPIEVTHAVVVRERNATWFPKPGDQSLQPTQRTAIDNFYLAGDWTRTGLPATIEGAVVSGHRAADSLSELLNKDAGVRVEQKDAQSLKKTEVMPAIEPEKVVQKSPAKKRETNPKKVQEKEPEKKVEKVEDRIMAEFQEVYQTIREHLEFDDENVLLKDPKRFRDQGVDPIVKILSEHQDPEVRRTFRLLVREIALSSGIIPSSLQEIYDKRSSTPFERMTIPAIFLPGQVYPLSRAVINAARDINAKALIFDISQFCLEGQNLSADEYASLVLCAAIKEAYAGPIFFQLSHCGFDSKEFFENLEGETFKMKTLMSSAVASGIFNFELDLTSLIENDDALMFAENQRAIHETCSELIKYLRSIEPESISVAIQIDISSRSQSNTSMEAVKAFLDGLNAQLDDAPKKMKKAAKLGVQYNVLEKVENFVPEKTEYDDEEPIVNVRKILEDLKNMSDFAASSYKVALALKNDMSVLSEDLLHRLPELNVSEAKMSGVVLQELVKIGEINAEQAEAFLKVVNTAEQAGSEEALSNVVQALSRLSGEKLEAFVEAVTREYAILFRAMGIMKSLDPVIDKVTMEKVSPILDDQAKRLLFS